MNARPAIAEKQGTHVTRRFHRLLAVLKKEYRQIGRDPLSLGLLIGVPALLLLLYGYALTFDVKHIGVGVLDEDRTPASRAFLDALLENPYFDRVRTLESRGETDGLLLRGDVRAVLIVPNGFAAGLNRGERVVVQALVDGADATSAATVEGYLHALAERVTRAAQGRLFAAAGLSPSLPVVIVEPRIWFNPELESGKFLVPGLIAMLLMLSCVIATSLSIVREKERQTLEQMMVSPLRPIEFVLGKTAPYVLIGLFTMLVILLVGYAFFGVSVRGSFLLLGLATLLFLVAALGMGVMISSATNSQQVAFQVAVIATILPSFLLSGFIFPIRNMPAAIQAITYVVPPRYFVSAIRAVILKDATFPMIWTDLVALLALGVLFNAVALRKTRKTM
jgi:ABC-2 type transport system permease protein